MDINNDENRPVNLISMLLGASLGFLLTACAAGFFWIGALGGVAYVWAAFAWSALGLAWRRDWRTGGLALCVGAAPLSLLLIRFRDASESHLVPVLIVTGWYVCIGIGTALAERAGSSNGSPTLRLRAVLAWFVAASVFHLGVSLWLILSAFGDSMQAFETGVARSTAFQTAMEWWLEPAISIWQQAPRSEARWVQWVLLAANGLTWASAATFVALFAWRARQTGSRKA